MTFSNGFSSEIFADRVKNTLLKFLPRTKKFQKTSIDFNFVMFCRHKNVLKFPFRTCWVPLGPVMSSLNVHTQTKSRLGNWYQESLYTNFVVLGFMWLLTEGVLSSLRNVSYNRNRWDWCQIFVLFISWTGEPLLQFQHNTAPFGFYFPNFRQWSWAQRNRW